MTVRIIFLFARDVKRHIVQYVHETKMSMWLSLVMDPIVSLRALDAPLTVKIALVLVGIIQYT